MSNKQSLINLVPNIYRKSVTPGVYENQSLTEFFGIVDGLIGRGELPGYNDSNPSGKFGLYERSQYFSDIYSLAAVRQHYRSGTFSKIFDGTIQDYIRWFCSQFDIFLDEAWVSALNPELEVSESAEVLTIEEVFEKISLSLFLSRKRGTLAAILGFLNIYLPPISQAAGESGSSKNDSQKLKTEKTRPYVYDGRDFTRERYQEELSKNNSFVVVFDKPYLDPKANYDFMVRIVYNGVVPEEMSKFVSATKSIIERERPAFAKYCLHVVVKGWQLEMSERSNLGESTLLSGEFKTIY